MTDQQRKRLYVLARSIVTEAGYGAEIDAHDLMSPHDVTEQIFLRETAWVILCSGFRERVVRSVFGAIGLSFWDFERASDIVADRRNCVRLARLSFDHEGKIKSIADVAALINAIGFAKFWSEASKSPIESFARLPFVGQVTKFHLAKNLGFDVCKPDRHLVVLASCVGSASVDRLCHQTAMVVGKNVRHVDMVLWRACAIVGSGNRLAQMAKLRS